VVLSSEKIAPRNVQLASLFCTNQRLWIRRFRASFHEADWPTSDLPAADEGGPSRRDVGLRRVQ
jgi:hypothetical protein